MTDLHDHLAETFPPPTAWDCDPETAFAPSDSTPYIDRSEEDASGDWQLHVLDRFGDREVCGYLYSHRDSPFRLFNETEELA